MTSMLFNICNTGILLCWFLLLLFPTSMVSKTIRAYPWVPLALSFAYVYFLGAAGGLGEADFTSLEGITSLFKKATPASAAAGWMHYLAFDFWMGCWIVEHRIKKGIPQWAVIPSLLATFMLGPVGVLVYALTGTIFYFIRLNHDTSVR